MPESNQVVVRGPFPKGVNYSRPPDEIRDDELYEMQNARLGNIGQVSKRYGTDPLNGTALVSGATVTACGKQRFSSSSSKTFAIVGAKFYENIEAATPDNRTSTNTITAGDDNTWETVNANGTLVGHNGVTGDSLLKWAASGNISALDVDSRFTWAKHVEYWDRRVWWANTSTGKNHLWYSSQDDPETYGALNFKIYDYDITGLKKGPGGLYVHTRNSIQIVAPTGDATTPYRYQDVILAEENMGGTESGRCLVNVPGIGQLFVRRDGIYVLTSAQELVKVSEKLDGARFWDNINPDRLAYSHAQIYPLRGWVFIWLPYGAAQTKMNRMMVFDYRLSKQQGEWVWHGPDTGLTRNCGAIIDDDPHFGGFDGFIYKHETGDVDNDGTTDNAYDGYFTTGQQPPLGHTEHCRWGKARTFFEVKGNHTVDAQEQSADIPSRTETLEMGGSYAGIGYFIIGVSAIGGGDIAYADRRLDGTGPFKGMQIRNSAANNPFTIRRIAFTYTEVGAIFKDTSGS